MWQKLPQKVLVWHLGVFALCLASQRPAAAARLGRAEQSAELNNKKYLKLFSRVCSEKYLYNNCIYTQIFLISDSWFHSTASKSQFIRQILLNILYLHIASLQIRQNNYWVNSCLPSLIFICKIEINGHGRALRIRREFGKRDAKSGLALEKAVCALRRLYQGIEQI